MSNLKSTINKTLLAAGLTFTGLSTVGAKNIHNQVKAATAKNDPKVVSVNYIPKYGIAVWNHGNTESKVTGQYLPHASSWKVIDSAYDAKGNKWYDLGKNQWVMEKYTRNGLDSVDPNTRFDYVAPVASTQAPQATGSYSTAASNYVSSVGGSEATAKAWIANRESGGSYTATNGQYIGKYQLSSSYLGGDYSAANQEKVADSYVKGRYGSWTAAQSFWQANGWY